jgi:hypothetical protein
MTATVPAITLACDKPDKAVPAGHRRVQSGPSGSTSLSGGTPLPPRGAGTGWGGAATSAQAARPLAHTGSCR